MSLALNMQYTDKRRQRNSNKNDKIDFICALFTTSSAVSYRSNLFNAAAAKPDRPSGR
jgi:hypothetical protein